MGTRGTPSWPFSPRRIRAARVSLIAAALLLTGCAASTPGPPTSAAPSAGSTVPTATPAPPSPNSAAMGFPDPDTQWLTRSTDESGRTWLAVWRVLAMGSYQGRPVFRVTDTLQEHLFDASNRNPVATLRWGKPRVETTPDNGTFRWPLEVGNRWVATYALRDHQRDISMPRTTTRWQVAAVENITVPGGTFRSFRLEGRNPARSFTLWYAPDLRLIVKHVEERRARDRLGAGRVVTELIDHAPAGGNPWFGFSYEAVQEALQQGQGREAMAFYERTATRLLGRSLTVEALEAQQAFLWAARPQGAYQQTIRTAQRALELLAAEPRTQPMLVRGLEVRFALGLTYVNAGAPAEAQRQYEAGLALATELSSFPARLFWTGLFSRGLASVASIRGDQAATIHHGEVAIKSFDAYLAGLSTDSDFAPARRNGRRQLGWALDIVASAYRRQGNHAAAAPLSTRVLDIARDLGSQELEVSASLGLAAAARSQERYDESLRRYEEARALATRLGHRHYLLVALDGIGWSAYRLRRNEQALEAFKEAVALVEETRANLEDTALRSGYLEGKQSMYQGAVWSNARLGRAGEAFSFAERGRARAFLDLLGTQTVLSKGKTRELIGEEVRLRAQLGEAKALVAAESSEPEERVLARQRLEAAEHAYRTFLARVRQESAEQAALMTVDPVTVAEVQRLLPQGTTLVEYLVGGPETLAWVIDGSRVEVVRLRIRRAELVSQVRAFREGIEGRGPLPDAQSRAVALHQRLFAPLRSRIHSERVILVPHDVLHYLPFGALRSPAGRWLIEDYALSTLPSASVLKYLGGKGEARASGALAVGNPDLGPALDLRYAEREVRVVGERFPGARVLIRDGASEVQAKALSGEMELLHFATHAELDEADPMRSALLLVPGGGEDGRLEVREVFGLDLHARLVVLSACETGLGKLSTGDELVGLQRAFLYAGTPAVVTTLWKVDDRSSFQLMRTFYERLATVDAASALRDAQRAALREHAHPYEWAAFVLTGVAHGAL